MQMQCSINHLGINQLIHLTEITEETSLSEEINYTIMLRITSPIKWIVHKSIYGRLPDMPYSTKNVMEAVCNKLNNIKDNNEKDYANSIIIHKCLCV